MFLMNLSNRNYRKLEPNLPPLSEEDKNDVMERTPEVMDLLIKVLSVRNMQCHEEALFAIGAVAANIEHDFAVRGI